MTSATPSNAADPDPDVSQEASAKRGPEVRFSFVEMLFALAIAEVAVVASHLVRAEGTSEQKLPVLAHLLLATVLIATSWLDWSSSRWRDEKLSVLSPFSWDFLGLLLDVLLVVLYFIVVRSAEIEEASPYKLLAPSARPEAIWIVRIFSVYVVWDFISDFVKEWPTRLLPAIALLIACTACSVIGTALACLTLALAHDTDTVCRVLLLDCCLLVDVLLFRIIKPLVENPFRDALPVLRDFAAFKDARPKSPGNAAWAAVLTGLYTALLLVGFFSR